MEKEDVKKLYEAFVALCDYVEQDTEDSCKRCPRENICFGENGEVFAKTLKRIKTEIDFK